MITHMLKHKKLVVFILCLSIILPSMLKQNIIVFGAAKGVCTASKLMIRSGSGQEYAAVKVNGEDAYLIKNQAVDIIASKNGWYKIKAVFKNIVVEGYSSAVYIKQAEDAGINSNVQKGICTAANSLMIRKGPGTEYNKVEINGTAAYLTNGQTVEILGSKNGWHQIKTVFMGTTVEGYSSAAYVRVIETAKAPSPAASPTKAPAASPTKAPATSPAPTNKPASSASYQLKLSATIAVSTKLNLRKTAGTSGVKLAELSNGHVVTVIGEAKSGTENWYKVTAKADGKTVTGYVLSNYVKINVGTGFYANILQNNVTPVTTAGGKYNLKLENRNVWKVNKGRTWISDEVTAGGQKWFRIGQSINGVTFRGYVKSDVIELLGKKVTAAVTPAPALSAAPSASPVPSVTPAPSPTPAIALQSNRASLVNISTQLTVRDQPGYSAGAVYDESGLVVLLYNGQQLKLHSVQELEGFVWYKVSFDYKNVEYTGYIRDHYIKFEEPDNSGNGTAKPIETSSDFEAMLTAQGFPESYKPYLRQLHTLYPNWQFEAKHTGLDWNTVINNESAPSINLIPNSKGIEWKSLDEKAYNWKTDSFIVYDGSTWVTASREAIAYYMDPRNFLDEKNIFQFEVLAYQPSYQNAAGVENILKNTALYNTSYNYVDQYSRTGIITYGDTFIKAAEYSGVSPYHLASRVKQEVVTGTTTLSNSVTGLVTDFMGMYNYYNIGAYHSTVAGGNIANGLKYAQNGSTNSELNKGGLIPWDNQYKSIVGGAYIIGSSYINKGQDTIYLQKFNVTKTSTYSHQYMSNVEAPAAEGKKVYTAYGDNVSNLPIVFSIPVYLNMPASAVKAPTIKYNPNNWLSSLNVLDMGGKNLLLTPAFNISADQEYYLLISADTDCINVTASAVSSKATVSGEGICEIKEKSNLIVVYVTAENGDIREYKITVVKES